MPRHAGCLCPECRDDGRRSERDRHRRTTRRIWSGRSTQEVAWNVPRRRETPEVSPTFAESEEMVAERFRCSARKVARGGLNAEGGIVGGDNANWVFE